MSNDRDDKGRFQPGHGSPGPGRPSEYREEFCETAYECMAAGYSKTATAGFLGVSKQTFDSWKANHPAFLAAVQRGDAARTMRLETDLIEAKDSPTVTSRIFALKNAAPEEWKDTHRTELTGAGGGPVKTESTLDVTKLSDETLAELIDATTDGG